MSSASPSKHFPLCLHNRQTTTQQISDCLIPLLIKFRFRATGSSGGILDATHSIVYCKCCLYCLLLLQFEERYDYVMRLFGLYRIGVFFFVVYNFREFV